eukprot:4701171-Alexandrium_andersonii.AAC.1
MEAAPEATLLESGGGEGPRADRGARAASRHPRGAATAAAAAAGQGTSEGAAHKYVRAPSCLLYTSPSPRD